LIVMSGRVKLNITESTETLKPFRANKTASGKERVQALYLLKKASGNGTTLSSSVGTESTTKVAKSISEVG